MSNLPELYSPRSIIAHSYNQPRDEYVEAEYVGYRVIDAATIKDKIMDYMGAVLARCWLDKTLMDRLVHDTHACLYEMGLVMPSDMHLVVHRERKNRPQLVLYENQRRICALQLKMTASR
jgi:hypothetical protein